MAHPAIPQSAVSSPLSTAEISSSVSVTVFPVTLFKKICDDFQLVNQFSKRNDNSHKEIRTFEIHEVVAQRLALPVALAP
jgi:hypothetical protein